MGAAAAEVDADERWSSEELRLLCAESLATRRAGAVSCHDDDRRVLQQLLLIDDRYIVASNPYVDGNITVRMRTQLAEWIYQVTTAFKPGGPTLFLSACLSVGLSLRNVLFFTA